MWELPRHRLWAEALVKLYVRSLASERHAKLRCTDTSPEHNVGELLCKLALYNFLPSARWRNRVTWRKLQIRRTSTVSLLRRRLSFFSQGLVNFDSTGRLKRCRLGKNLRYCRDLWLAGMCVSRYAIGWLWGVLVASRVCCLCRDDVTGLFYSCKQHEKSVNTFFFV